MITNKLLLKKILVWREPLSLINLDWHPVHEEVGHACFIWNPQLIFQILTIQKSLFSQKKVPNSEGLTQYAFLN